MSDADPSTPIKARRSGCQWVAALFVAVMALGAPVLQSFIAACLPKEKKLHPQTVIKDIKYAVLSYETDYNHFPVPASDRHGPDVSLRSRGPILPALMGEDATLNPKEIKFIDFPAAKDRKFGLWQDGGEWVLSDLWGEPYYITLDTNKDGKVANPEPRGENIPAMFDTAIILYSSGPDRDPKTWKDNVCSWYSR